MGAPSLGHTYIRTYAALVGRWGKRSCGPRELPQYPFSSAYRISVVQSVNREHLPSLFCIKTSTYKFLYTLFKLGYGICGMKNLALPKYRDGCAVAAEITSRAAAILAGSEEALGARGMTGF